MDFKFLYSNKIGPLFPVTTLIPFINADFIKDNAGSPVFIFVLVSSTKQSISSSIISLI